MAKVPTFDELIAATTRRALHLEQRDAYTPEDPDFLAWKAGSLARPLLPDWSKTVETHTARGVDFRRLRVISEPVADYIKFEHSVTAELNVAAGEHVRWLPRSQTIGLLLPPLDFWIFDDKAMRFHHFSGAGEIISDELCQDATVIKTCTEAFEQAWERGFDHREYKIS